VTSPQTLAEADRRIVAMWAADCAERVLGVFEAEAPGDLRPREAIARTRAFARGELGAAGEIRRRFANAGAARQVSAPSAVAAARAAGQLPPVGENRSGPLGPGLLASGVLGDVIRELQAGLADHE
jgi:immunity protein 5 of polymorphic toxin system